MRCHECGRQIAVGDRFCTGCGIPLDGVTEPTRPHPTPPPRSDDAPAVDASITDRLPPTQPLDELWDDDPVWAPSGSVPLVDGGGRAAPTATRTGDLPATEPVTEVWMRGDDDAVVVAGAVATDDRRTSAVLLEDATITAAMPTAVPLEHAWPADGPAPGHRFRFSALTLIATVGGIALLVAMFLTIVEVTSSVPLLIGENAPPAFRTGIWIADDLGDNLSVAGLIAALCMVVGAVAASFGWRWGAGLAGGGGLAAAGLAALVVGLAQYPIDAAHAFAEIPSEQQFTLTITRAVGYWLIVVAGAIGVVAFFAATNEAVADRGGLNPWIAALGALAAVVATAGPMLPEGSALFSDNWYVIERPGEAPAMLVAMRLVQLGTLALGGIIGFLSVRRWGLGVAAGVSLPVIWLGVSTLFELGDSPVGPAFRNPGASSTELHGVTIIGISALLAMLVLATVAAYDQSARRR